MLRRSLLAALIVCAASPASAQTLDIAGVKVPPTAQVGNATVPLNGAGIRYKFVVKVYVAALYVAQRTASADAAIAQPGAKRMQVTMLREIDANDLGRLFTRGMQDNAAKDEFSKSIPGTIRMAEIFSTRKKLVAGDVFSVDYVPGLGTTVLLNGKPQSEPIREPEFFAALLRIWLGASPADAQLKEALLGAVPRNASGQQ